MRDRLRDDRDETIERLRNELYITRREMLHLMPDDISSLLDSYHRCESRQAAYAWEQEIATALIQRVERPRDPGQWEEQRANCPLCNSGAMTPYASGFSLPTGLERHLTGWGSQIRQCSVMRAAAGLAWEHWNDRFGPGEQEERLAAERARAKRLATELTFLLGPGEPPQLRDRFGAEARDDDELAWAEGRLRQLQFEVTNHDRATAYIKKLESFQVFADPRARGRIDFCVYPEKRRKLPRYSSFYLRDEWKIELQQKFDSRLAQALRVFD